MKSSASEPNRRNWKKMGEEEKGTCVVGVAMCDFKKSHIATSTTTSTTSTLKKKRSAVTEVGTFDDI